MSSTSTLQRRGGLRCSLSVLPRRLTATSASSLGMTFRKAQSSPVATAKKDLDLTFRAALGNVRGVFIHHWWAVWAPCPCPLLVIVVETDGLHNPSSLLWRVEPHPANPVYSRGFPAWRSRASGSPTQELGHLIDLLVLEM